MTADIPLGIQDAAMLLAENLTPLHIGGVAIYRPPADAPEDYIQRLVHHLRSHRVRSAPWNYRLASGKGLFGWMTPKWETVKNVDLDSHVAHYSLPSPGGRRELERLVSLLHSRVLDLDQPLWEFSVIDGLADGRFAVYQKIHHALLDGVRGMQLVAAMHADDAATTTLPPWALPSARVPRRRVRIDTPIAPAASAEPSALESVERAFESWRRATAGKRPELILPQSAPRSSFNVPISRRREIATQDLELARVKAVSRVAGCTVNDVLVCACGGALRRYMLQQRKRLPKTSLIAAVPMSVTRQESGLGNSLAIICANLGTNLDGERDRLAKVQASTAAGKQYMQSMPDWMRVVQGTLTMLPAALGIVIPGIKPFANIVVASVRGPASEKYFFGARLEAFFGTSVILKGHALNITCTNQVDRMCFGLVACPKAVPHLDRLAGYIADSFAQLEHEVLSAGEPSGVRGTGAGAAAHTKNRTKGARKSAVTAEAPRARPASTMPARRAAKSASKKPKPSVRRAAGRTSPASKPT